MASGQKVNWEKSALCGVNVDEIELMSTASSLGCKADHLPLFYLGVGTESKVTFWQPVIDKVHKNLDKWKRFNLSRGGRATLCKSVLSNLPTYCMPTFLMPEGSVADRWDSSLASRSISFWR